MTPACSERQPHPPTASGAWCSRGEVILCLPPHSAQSPDAAGVLAQEMSLTPTTAAWPQVASATCSSSIWAAPCMGSCSAICLAVPGLRTPPLGPWRAANREKAEGGRELLPPGRGRRARAGQAGCGAGQLPAGQATQPAASSARGVQRVKPFSEATSVINAAIGKAGASHRHPGLGLAGEREGGWQRGGWGEEGGDSYPDTAPSSQVRVWKN